MHLMLCNIILFPLKNGEEMSEMFPQQQHDENTLRPLHLFLLGCYTSVYGGILLNFTNNPLSSRLIASFWSFCLRIFCFESTFSFSLSLHCAVIHFPTLSPRTPSSGEKKTTITNLLHIVFAQIQAHKRNTNCNLTPFLLLRSLIYSYITM